MKKNLSKLSSSLIALTLILFPVVSFANNLSISDVTLTTRDLQANTVVVRFNVRWENSWRNKINHDAIWLTFRLNESSEIVPNKKLCQMSAAGVTPTGFSAGTSQNLELYIPTDKTGAFLRRSVNALASSVSTESVEVKLDYSTCGFSSDDEINASVFGLEMVLIPQGAFYAGDQSTSVAALTQGSSDNDPWYISNEGAISVSNSASNGFRYVSNNNVGESATGAAFTLPATFPKGYQSFYVMKYELTEGQWVEFVNSLPGDARANRDLTDSAHKNSDSVTSRNTIACSGSPIVCSTDRPWRAVSYLSWMDLAAFLDWNALRPITELEFEKIARGPVLAVNGEYAWGTTDIISATTLSGTSEDGSETVTTSQANAQNANIALNGGDAPLGVEYQRGPLLVGIFANNASTRVEAGAGYYGVLDLSGNLNEHVVTIGNAAGQSFSGAHGNGVLSSAAGFEGNSDVANWPGLDSNVARGVTGATGSGFRGGSWIDVQDRLRISDRFEAALASTSATNTFGGRGARTYDGN